MLLLIRLHHGNPYTPDDIADDISGVYLVNKLTLDDDINSS